MSEISKVPIYDPANPYAVLNPWLGADLIPTTKNATVVPPYTQIRAEADLEVMGGGSPLVNGKYVYSAAKTYTGPAGYTIGLVADYPSGGINSVCIKNSANIHYYTDDTADLIGKLWRIGSFGVAPVPGIVTAVKEAAAGTQLRAEGEQAKAAPAPEAPRAKKKFLDF